MPWKDAKQDAAKWLLELNLPMDLHGLTIDLRTLGEKLPVQGPFRLMVLRAAARELRHRGAKIK